MTSARSALRLGALLLAFLTLFVPFGVGARAGVSCDDFANPDAAQALLDSDEDYADSLDPDGDGIACNEDGEDKPRDDNASSDGDYLAAVSDEVDTISDSIDHFFETMMSSTDASNAETAEIADEMNEIAAMWADYPDSAPDLDAPADYAGIDDLYQDFASSVGEMGEGWQDYWQAAMREPDEDHTPYLEAFDETVIATEDLADEITALIEDAAGEDSPAADEDDEPRDDASTGTAYLDAVWDEVDTISDSLAQFMETYYYAGDENTTGDDFDAAIDELTETAAMWATYPEEAPEFDVPAEYDHIDAAWQEFVASVGDTGEAWQAYWDSPNDDTELFAEFNDHYVDTQDYAFAIMDLIAAAEEGAPIPDEDATDFDEESVDKDDADQDAGEDTANDAEAYLDAVRTHFDELIDSYNRFNEILESGEFTADDEEEIQDIYVIWADARSVAADVEAPDGYEEIHEAYLAVANGFSESYELYSAWINTESGSEEEEEALAAYEQSIVELNELAIELDELLKDAGV
jgi:hypothetical protein